MSVFSCVLIGNETLIVTCGDQLLERGCHISAIITENQSVKDWALTSNIPVKDRPDQISSVVSAGEFDWLLSIANLKILSDDILAMPKCGSLNFHDGPLPRYAGLNTPVWALMNDESKHGITWHFIEPGIDTGDIVVSRVFDVAEDETAHSLNARCYAAGTESFAEVLDLLSDGVPAGQKQGTQDRQYFAKNKRPDAFGVLDFRKTSAELERLVRALDFTSYWNPITCPKLVVGEKTVLVGTAKMIEGLSGSDLGAILEVRSDFLTVATMDGAVRLSELRDAEGREIDATTVAVPGDRIDLIDVSLEQRLNNTAKQICGHDDAWRQRLKDMQPIKVPLSRDANVAADWAKHEISAPVCERDALAAAALWGLNTSGQVSASIAWCSAQLADLQTGLDAYVSGWVPVAVDKDSFAEFRERFLERVATAERLVAFARDLWARDTALTTARRPEIAISRVDAPVSDAAVTIAVTKANSMSVYVDQARVGQVETTLMIARLESLLNKLAQHDSDMVAIKDISSLPAAEIDILTTKWSHPGVSFDHTLTLNKAFERQVAETPDATALIYENTKLSYTALNARANVIAKALQDAGVARGTNVAICLPRGVDLIAGVMAILKAGGAYVPLDPSYPQDRITHCINDSAAPVILTHTDLAAEFSGGQAKCVFANTQNDLDVLDNVDGGALPQDLAYLIYTSGSTGTPKGVMVEHRNVSNFFTGMDAHIDQTAGNVWLAVTSLAFDISVLEIFYTLSRGFTVVVSGDENRAAISGGRIRKSSKPMDFSLYYWGNDDGPGRQKYELLLEGAKFADQNGFAAVWTPERHFHAFGGLYPNPSVTGAAVAAVTSNLSVRAGSCVAPLHHPARIAEEWSVIDNMTDGKAGLAFASGWQPDDFVLRPENTPPSNKRAMYDALEQVRKLWRGEAVAFEKQNGDMHEVVTQPRPVSAELPVWVTTAGNPETWREAGELGANVLTHLLGQSIAEVEGKIKIYHEALVKAGHDPEAFTVTMMLHSFVADTRDMARAIAREPMKDYLRSAAGLIKQYAWAFPAFKKPEGVTNPFEMDLGQLDEDELEAILDFAFERYFEESGLFGTIEEAVDRAEELRAIGVTEIACLIDYGIASETVLAGLRPLADVLKRVNVPSRIGEDDFSIAAQIARHGVTHLQATPSMARLFAMNDEARSVLGDVKQLFLGGEALPGSLVADLRGCTDADIFNMYGPTETTIWSSVAQIDDPADGAQPIGHAIANTDLRVMDARGDLCPIGVEGELWIGGAGVTRGYWQRSQLTQERYVEGTEAGQGRFYRTGDLVRWQADGTLEFLGRTDHQIKIRGQRIELGEIETELKSFAGVTDAIVVPHDGDEGDTRLAAYYTNSAVVPESVLRAHLKSRLPDAMVPAYLMPLANFPLTPNKKIDRKALPAPRVKTEPSQTSVAAVQGSHVARIVADVWADVLGVRNVGLRDNFFDLGGHSLLAVQAHRDLRRAIDGSTLSITDIFRFPVFGDLVMQIEKSIPGATRPESKVANVVDRSNTMSKRRAMRAGRRGAGQ